MTARNVHKVRLALRSNGLLARWRRFASQVLDADSTNRRLRLKRIIHTLSFRAARRWRRLAWSMLERHRVSEAEEYRNNIEYEYVPAITFVREATI